MTITLTLPLPPSANRNWKASGSRVYKSVEASQYQHDVRWECRAAGIDPLQGKVAVIIDAYFTHTRSDLDNVTKVLFDALNGFVWQDDRQVYQMCLTKHIDRSNPRIELQVMEIETS